MSDIEAKFAASEAKMRAEGLPDAAILAFKHSFMLYASGSTGMIPESEIQPATDVPNLSDIKATIKPDPKLLSQTVVLKLNGGLGTSMGLDFAKSLLEVKGKDTFLDLTAKQVIQMRKEHKAHVRFLLMNSFSTSADTMKYLQKYPEIVSDPDLEFVQNKVPKLDASSQLPGDWAKNPKNEWCPPGHGDLYAALEGSGTLDKLLASGVKYMFVSNSDNLGATLDMDLLTYFAEKDLSFMMECCERTVNDKKGGHLCVRNGQNILREAAQCADEDEEAFQDISKHRFFNTNNLWIRLDKLKEEIDKSGGFIPLPMIKNAKTIDPKDDASTKVIQLETAMGAAIECFAGSGAVCVPRERFAPVKKCGDLLMLRSDCYVVTPDARLVTAPGAQVPEMSLDSKKYKLVQSLEESLALGTPSLKGCTKLKVDGMVHFSRRNVIVGKVTIVNKAKEAKVLPPGTYADCTVDLSSAPGLGALAVAKVATAPIAGQKPGTSGLRKKTRVFMEGAYLHNFVQAALNVVKTSGADMADKTLVLGGDGRYYNPEAIQIIIKMAVANGVKHLAIGQGGLLSTPAVSAIIRERGPSYMKAFGSFILTASHNPGGPEEDFGIKYNVENGGPAPEGVTDAIYANTTTIGEYGICPDFPDIDLNLCGITKVESTCGSSVVTVEVIDAVEDHVELLKNVFDFSAIKALLDRPDFSMVYDSMHGVNGPYAKAVFVEELGQDAQCLINSVPKQDFNGGHADPNLTYAKDLVKIMGLTKTGLPAQTPTPPPSFGAAADGDADRNMICGSQFFVTPSDSLAILADHANVVPFFRDYGGLKAVARSMPTSGAVDLVAKKNNLALFETPTGWKYFGNLMDSKELFGGEDYTPLICGEESFGTGSNHIREKDGMFAVLFWLSVLADYNKDPTAPLVSVQAVVEKHWEAYGRNYYTRYDYEGVAAEGANAMFEAMRSDGVTSAVGKSHAGFTVATADDFTYFDPVDGSVSKKQGIRFLMEDGSRIVFRLSGTAGSGATVRMYLEKYEADPAKTKQVTADVMGGLVEFALQLSQLTKFTGVETPTVIT